MFSGIVETIGCITQTTDHAGCKDFVITTTEIPFSDIHMGDSIAVNGICLTVTAYYQHTQPQSHTVFHVTAVPETLKLTHLHQLKKGDAVNLERAMRADQRMGGHFVQGHIDGTGKIIDIQDESEDTHSALLVTIRASQAITRYTVPKGFITIDGMSITLIDTTPEYFTVTFIPHTISHTIVKHYTVGTCVNLEADILAKTVKKLLENYV